MGALAHAVSDLVETKQDLQDCLQQERPLTHTCQAPHGEGSVECLREHAA